MSRRTVTLTAPNGVKVRTVLGKRFYAVRYGELHATSHLDEATQRVVIERLDPPQPYAKVVKRTDSAKTAYREYDQHAHAVVVFEPRWVDGQIGAGTLSRGEVKLRADAGKEK
jgi:aminopeptidase N